MRKTIKRIVAGLAAFLIILSIVVMFTGCASTRAEATEVDVSNDGDTFVCVDSDYCCWIVYHKDTKVMYAISNGQYNRGTVTLLVNADGTPMIWEG